MDKRLGESDFRWQLLENIPDPAWVTDLNKRYLAVTKALCDFAGASESDVIGKTPADFFPSEVVEECDANNKKVLATGLASVWERWVHNRAGKRMCAEVHITPVRDSDGNIVGLSGYVRDITRAKLAMENLRLAAESAEMGTWEIDFETGAVVWDEQACRMTGRDPADRIGDISTLSVVLPEDQGRVEAAIGTAMTSESSSAFHVEYRTTHADGSIRWLSSKGRVYFDGEGRNRKPRRLRSTLLDVTDRKKADEQLQQFQHQLLHLQKLESLGVMAGGMAHDFNNILAGILGYCDLAARQLSNPNSVASSIAEIKKAAIRASRLTAQMLDYTGQGRFATEKIHLEQIVEEIRPILDASMQGRSLVQCFYADGLPAIEADPAQMRQMTRGLLVNAIEALGEKPGAITLRVDIAECIGNQRLINDRGEGLPEGRYVCLEVRDTGCGMEPEVMKRMYEPFFTTKFTGRGLGLAAVQGIVNSHRGAIHAESTPGKGSTFRIYLPVNDL